MAEESERESSGSKGLEKSLTKKLGPLPVWAWALIGGAAGYWYLKKKGGKAGTGAPVVATPTTYGGGGGGGGGDLGQNPTTPPVVTTTPVTVSPPPTSTLGPHGENLDYPGSPGLLTGFQNYGVDLGLGGPTGQGPGVFTTFYNDAKIYGGAGTSGPWVGPWATPFANQAAGRVAAPTSFAASPYAQAYGQSYQQALQQAMRPVVPWSQVPYAVPTFGR